VGGGWRGFVFLCLFFFVWLALRVRELFRTAGHTVVGSFLGGGGTVPERVDGDFLLTSPERVESEIFFPEHRSTRAWLSMAPTIVVWMWRINLNPMGLI